MKRPAAGKDEGRAQRPFTVLFVCTGNAARSQMAEGLAGHLGGGRIEAHSAGTHPAGVVMGGAREVMRERGIDMSRHYSKSVDDVPGPFDLVITLCDSAVKECPAALIKGEHEHWSTPDPTFVDGGPDEVLAAFRQVRDRLEAQITALIQRVRPREKKS